MFSRRDLVPPDRAAALEAEGVVIRHGNVSTTVRLEDYRAPGRYSALRWTRVRAALVVTRARLVVFVRGPVGLDAAYADRHFDALELRAGARALVIGFDPALFDPRTSGRVDLTCRIPEPERALEWVRAQRRAVG